MIGSQQALQVKMFPYLDPITGLVLTPAQICDNSPNFIADPTALAILNPNDTIYYQNFAIDPDNQDSTVFGIDFPLSNTLQPYAYNPPYSQANPVPGIIGPPFITAANTPINPTSGEVVFRPTAAGTFVTVIKVTSYRCGQKISEVFRDFSLKIIPNPPGSPPPFIPNTANPLHSFSQRAPIIQPYFLDAAGLGLYEVTYYAGDTITIPVSATDLFPLFTGNPADPTTWVPQTNTFSVVFNGSVLSTTNNPAAGCPFPPCATIRGLNDPNPPGGILNPPTPINGGNGNLIGLGYNATVQGGGKLVWMPECSNLPENALTACGTSVSSYQVSITATDQNCPIEGKDVRVYTFSIANLPILPAPTFFGVSGGVTNTTADLHFELDFDTISIDPIDSFNYSNQTQAAQRFKSVERRKRSFQYYRIYRATALGGPYTLIDSINQLYTYQWTDTGLDLANNDYYYYMTTISSCGGNESLGSDTLKVIKLNVVSNLVAGQAELSWDSTAIASGRAYPNNATGKYYIEREIFTINPGVWELIDSVQDQYTYVQPVVVCEDSVNYRVGLEDTSGRIYYSSIDGDVFEDIFPPDSILIHHVSVDSMAGLPVLSWQPGPSPDVISYQIYRMDISTTPVTAIPIALVNGYNNTWWVDNVTGQSPYDSSLHYGIAGIDSCGNIGLISRRHSTVHLTGGLDQCSSSIIFDFTPYVGWDQVNQYVILRSEGSGPWTRHDSLPGGQANYNYIDNRGLIQDSLYCYAIIAQRSSLDDTIALSNTLCVTAGVIEEPEYSYIRNVTVDTATNLINVLFAIDQDADAGRFEIYRTTNATDFSLVGGFSIVDMTPVGASFEYNFIDLEAEPDKEIYYYQILVYDVCDQLYDSSNVSNNIYLQAVPAIEFVNRLRWNSYATWPTGVDRYEILRLIPNYDPGFLPLAQVGPASIVHVDDIKDFTDNDGLYSYLVEAVEAPGNPYGFQDRAFSNRVDVIQQPRMFMPTAFLPEGVNRELKPKGVFIEETTGYTYEIYNRWGELIFQTVDFNKGWDGTHQAGVIVDPGVYVFVVNFIGKNGKPYSQNGTFTVIR